MGNSIPQRVLREAAQAAEDPVPAADGAGTSSSGGADAPAAVAPPLPGPWGPYEVRAALPSLGVGRLFDAHDGDQARRVLLRLVPLFGDPDSRERLDALFETCLQQARGLRHPAIAQPLQTLAVAEGVVQVLDWLPGRTLEQALAALWQPAPAEAATLVATLAQALGEAHRQGIVHGSLAPCHVHLLPDLQPRLLGFGLADAAQRCGLPEFDPLVACAPHYLAPEQLRGAALAPTADVHALGALLYELLTGRKAYPGHTVPQIAQALLHHRPAAPHMLRPEVPRGLSELAMRALDRQPEVRHPDGQALFEDLSDWLARACGMPATAARTDRSEPAGATRAKAVIGWPQARAGGSVDADDAPDTEPLAVSRPRPRGGRVSRPVPLAADESFAPTQEGGAWSEAEAGRSSRRRWWAGAAVMAAAGLAVAWMWSTRAGVPPAQPAPARLSQGPAAAPTADRPVAGLAPAAGPALTAVAADRSGPGPVPAALGVPRSTDGAAAVPADDHAPGSGMPAAQARPPVPAADAAPSPALQSTQRDAAGSLPVARSSPPAGTRATGAAANGATASRTRSAEVRTQRLQRPVAPVVAEPWGSGSAEGEDAAPRPAVGVVRLAISPWGQVEVNGRPVGVSPPLTQLELQRGPHTITVRNGDFAPHATAIEVQPDRVAQVRHRFGP